jgi:hypothetical protein
MWFDVSPKDSCAGSLVLSVAVLRWWELKEVGLVGSDWVMGHHPWKELMSLTEWVKSGRYGLVPEVMGCYREPDFSCDFLLFSPCVITFSQPSIM